MQCYLTALILCGGLAANIALGAIPTPISSTPGQGQSPATGQTSVSSIPDPVGQPGDAHHPLATVGNRPPLLWFQNSFYPEVVALENAVSELYNWSYYNDAWSNMDTYAYWLWNTVYQIRTYTYQSGYTPYFYPAWNYYVTRGDLLYWNYYWVRPLYFQILREGATYNSYSTFDDPNHAIYLQKLIKLRNAYHRFVICIHGRNGSDAEAASDTETQSFENDAGI